MARVILEYRNEKALADRLDDAVRNLKEKHPGVECRIHKHTILLDGYGISGAADTIMDIAGTPYMAKGARHLLCETLARHGKKLTRRFSPYDQRRYVIDL